MKRAILFYNPISGDHRTPRKLDYILGRFQENNTLLQPYRLTNYNEAELLRILKHGKLDYIITSGGDGTLNYMVNLVLSNNLDIPIGIIPSGTCNDFARSINIPSSVNHCLDIILGGKTRSIDVGVVNDNKYFLSSCAGGILVDVSFNTHNELKKNFGPFAYYLKALSEMKNIRPFKIRIKTDHETLEDEAMLFLILNGKHVGGFKNLLDADLSDGLMDIMLIKNCSHIDLAGLFFKILSNDPVNDRNVTTLTARNCLIESDNDVPVSVDGEKGPALPISVSFINKKLKVFVK